MKRYFSLLALTMTGIALWFTLGDGAPLTVFERPANPVTLTQSYLKQGVMWRYDDDGVREQTLTVGTGVQFTDSPQQHLTGLLFEGADNDGTRWTVVAGAGLLENDGDSLQLYNDVEIRETRGLGVLTTPTLSVDLNEQVAINNSPVTLKLRNSTTTATGLQVNMKTGQARLLSNVETVYEG